MLIVTDFEATCLDRSTTGDMEYEAFLLQQEIIEIGCCIVDEVSLDIIHKLSIIIKPYFNKDLSDFCKNLTGITQSEVDNGLNFQDAMEVWIKWIGHLNKNRYALLSEDSVPLHVFCSWGAWDWKILGHNLQLHNLRDYRCELFDDNWDIKRRTAAALDIKAKGLGKACRYLGIGFKGSPHSGLDDAINVARVMQEIKKRGLDDFIVKKAEE